MKIQEQIIDFFDEGLSITDERQLFASLASDDSIRNDFKHQYKIDRSIYENMNSFKPNAKQSANVFGAIGLSMVPPTNTLAGKSNFLNYLFVGAGSTIATIIIMLLLMKGNAEPMVSDDHKSNTPIIIRDTVVKISEPKDRIIIKKQDINDDHNETIKENDREFASLIQPGTENNNFDKNLIKHNKDDFSNNIPLIDYKDISSINTATGRDFGLSFEIFTSTYWFNPDHYVPPTYYSNLNRLGAAIFYDITDDLSLGVDIRRETFKVNYQGEDDGQYYNYFQQPNLTTIGLNARYDLLSINRFDVFGKMNLGWNIYGYLLRPGVGLKYFISENVYFLLDLEYSQMIFKHQNNSFTAEKYGFNYGINVKF